MALPQGINFRASSGFVTDGADEHFEDGADGNDYPTVSAQGNNVGWESGRDDGFNADRSSGIDARLSGINYQPFSLGVYRISLPGTGAHNARLAAGDHDGGGGAQSTLKDNTTSFAGPIAHDPISATFWDAADNELSSANWPGSNAVATRTFTSTIFRCEVDGVTRSNAAIAHLYIESAGGGGGEVVASKLLLPAYMRGGMGSLSGGFQ